MRKNFSQAVKRTLSDGGIVFVNGQGYCFSQESVGLKGSTSHPQAQSQQEVFVAESSISSNQKGRAKDQPHPSPVNAQPCPMSQVKPRSQAQS
jgi:hypothetical protein